MSKFKISGIDNNVLKIQTSEYKDSLNNKGVGVTLLIGPSKKEMQERISSSKENLVIEQFEILLTEGDLRTMLQKIQEHKLNQ